MARCHLTQASELVQGFDDRRLAAKEDAGIIRFKRQEAAIGRAHRVMRRRPIEEARIEAGFDEAFLQAPEPGFGEQPIVPLAIGRRRFERLLVVALRQMDQLPGRRQLRREVLDRDVLDEDAE